ncbi:transcription termination/antitermination protein NusG [Muribaculum intestinale]|uniref:transcription termination/antitermination protein NusG n=1 Tax=Muribaculum intestinale TaxID=1796646 RepID=UPI00260EE45A|nr:transcription termination/antitermination protein NusG [Muribaculum intestinale]
MEKKQTSEAVQTHNKPQRAWYVLRAISGKEAKVKEVLDGAIKNSDLGNYVFQVLIPTEKVLTIKNGKKVVKEKNLYSGYVFVECILVGEVQHELVNTTNVIDFLKGRGKDAKPEPLRESEVMRMLGTADDINENAEDAANDFMVGEIVKINDGAFSGFHGKITDVLPEKKKIRIVVKIFDRETPMELEYSKVERE